MWELSALVRRDHDDLDEAVVALIASITPRRDLADIFDVMRLGLAVHIIAETRTLDALRARHYLPDAPRRLIEHVRDEHRRQLQAAESLLAVCPGSEAWYAAALELRIALLAHATGCETTKWTFQDHLGADERRWLAADYASERLRALGITAPLALAHELTGNAVRLPALQPVQGARRRESRPH
ncbi:MAG TPA: hypothetical protein VLX92_06710 [Kofleriaceae bacterium]|nr:hypothetical protein [Kofleriaceae bacterium]